MFSREDLCYRVLLFAGNSTNDRRNDRIIVAPWCQNRIQLICDVMLIQSAWTGVPKYLASDALALAIWWACDIVFLRIRLRSLFLCRTILRNIVADRCGSIRDKIGWHEVHGSS